MGNALYAPGKAQPKKHTEHKIVGKPIKREDVAPKVFAQEDFCTDIKVPGMVHGRMIRPAVAGAVPVKVDESSIKDIPGAKVVCDQDGFLGVVADKEWDAIKAAAEAQGRMVEGRAAVPEPERALRPHPQGAGAQARGSSKPIGNVDEAFKTAATRDRGRVRMAVPVARRMGPACALVEIKDGKVTCWSGSQKSHFVPAGRRRHARRAGRQGPRASG